MIALTHLSYAQTTSPAAVLGVPRSWQREKGASFMAELRGVEGGKVILQAADGRTATLELADLSRVDRDYVRGKMGTLAQRWLSQLAPAVKPAADRSGWPTMVRVRPESLRMSVKRPFQAGKGMKFASTHFEFDAPVEISDAEQRSIATPFELIHEVWRLAPWGVITPPKGGGLFQVELFLHTAAYEAAGAVPNSGCHYDHVTKKLRVLGSAIGLDPGHAPLWRDEQSQVPALTYSTSLLLQQNLLLTMPTWLAPALSMGMRDLPIQGEQAWPLEMLADLEETTSGTNLTEAEVRRYLSSQDEKDNAPLEREKMRRMGVYLMRKDGSKGANLGAFIAAISTDLPAWEQFFARMSERREAVKKSRNDPATTVPEAPTAPFGIENPNDFRWYHLSKLLGTPDIESGLQKAILALTKNS